ncbi:V-type proton ATPase 116 kDa subunit a [Spodoptera litura]|uniref:V-type proton ATPase subunit a n=1 Tax=Spodoptera litura TaxID=69820 RepID=A0A9J7IUH5_SPOLT|nr:V-type proton ATPase 116 kDa subunit a [Spodoptera litura]
MGAMFRSEEMALCQLFIQPEAAYTSVSELGEAGSVQFRDLNPDVNAFQRKFVNEVRRCDEMERKLRYIEAEVHKDGVHIPAVKEAPRAPNPREIIDLEAHLEKTENEILELSHNAVNLKQNYLELTELRHVLEKTEAFFIAQEEIGMDSMTKSLISDETGQQAATRGRLGFVAGVVNRERVPAFERMLWRISRGNVFLRRAELDKPLEDPATVSVYCNKVDICFSSLRCLSCVLNQTSDHRQRVLASVAKELASWTIMVRKMKAIYHTLNLFNMDVTKKCLIGECWVPTQDLPNVQKALADGSNACGSSIPSFLNCIETDEEPPTFNRTNRFTRGFQNLIDSYGVASYRECNPALYTTITFPFLFAVMFGDLGHGCIMALFGAWMVCKEVSLGAKKSNNEIWNIFFAGRYIILLMGCFSMYTGLVYNDIFSKSMNIFGSSWSIPYDNDTMEHNAALTLDPKDAYNNNPYFIGIDPVWQSADNKIIFLNSYKMKLSIIFGVLHMIFGVCMSVVNYNFFRRRYSIVLEFLPQVIFLCLLFLYMVFMMFYKWVAYSAFSDEQAYTPGCAPSVLILFINMMLFSSTPPPEGCNEYMFEAQASIQRVFVLIALCCIPVMLLGKPLYLLAAGKKKKEAKPEHSNGSVNPGIEMQEQTDIGDGAPKPEAKPAASGHDHEDEPFSEIMIHQAIHTIEYVLSTISHTASYLRLWALSLAHAELSEVLWNMVLTFGLKDHDYIGGIKLYVAFCFWALFTLAILVMMEGLSAFLHTLRLHWVEFMSKFYSGLGYIFQPFCFKTILEQEENKDD